MNHSKTKPACPEWNKHKAFIRRRYIIDQTPHKELVRELNHLGLSVSASQLLYKLKQWKFFRNIDKETWTIIDLMIKNRTRDGKQSEVIHCGRRLSQVGVIKATNRYRYIPTLARPRPPIIPVSPISSDLAVCTPQPVNMEFEWPSTLPWFDFQTKHLSLVFDISHIYGTGSRRAPRLSISQIDPMPIDSLWIYRHQSAYQTPKANKLAITIAKRWPESYPGEHLQRAHIILGEPTGDATYEYLAFTIFYLSNKISNLNTATWPGAIQLLQTCGVLHLKVNLWESNNLTIRAFMENLFNATVPLRSRHNLQNVWLKNSMAVLKWLLSCGYPPDSHIIVENIHSLAITPLHAALYYHDFEFAGSLLHRGANPNLESPIGTQNLPLVAAVREAKNGDYLRMEEDYYRDTASRMVELLLQHGASAGIEEALHFAIRMQSMDAIDVMIRYGAKLDGIIGLSGGFSSEQGHLRNKWAAHKAYPIYQETALSAAASQGTPLTQKVLDILAVRYPERLVKSFVTPDAFAAAAFQGHTQTICLLYGACIDVNSISHSDGYCDINSPNLYGITPLHAAASRGHSDTCQMLLRLHESCPSHTLGIVSPLHLASNEGHRETVRLLLDHGADVNGVSLVKKAKDPWESRLHGLITGHSCDHLLLAPLQTIINDVLDKSIRRRATAVLDCAAILVENGAKLTGNVVTQAATYSHLGLLTAALAAGGDPNECFDGKTALQLALKVIEDSGSDAVSAACLLLEHGANLVAGDMVAAAVHGDWDLMNDLISRGGSLMETDNRGTTVLEAALLSIMPCTNRVIDKIFILQPGIYCAGSLCAAILIGNQPIIQRLIKNRPIETTPSILEMTAIGIASQRKNLAVLEMLLAMFGGFACPNVGLIPIDKAPSDAYATLSWWSEKWVQTSEDERKVLQITKTPFWRGCDGQDYVQGSPLTLVGTPVNPMSGGPTTEKAEALFGELLRYGYKPDRFTWNGIAELDDIHLAGLLKNHSEFDETMAMMDVPIPNPLIAAIRSENKEMIEILLAVGADINEHDLYEYCHHHEDDVDGEYDVELSRSPLQEALKLENLEIIDFLLEKGARLDNLPVKITHSSSVSIIARPRSPLIPVIRRYDKDLLLRLISIVADVNEHNLHVKNSRSPLQQAVELGDLDIIDCLFTAGAKVNAPPAHVGGATALQLAAIQGYLGIVKLLIHEHKANVNAPMAKEEGRTALEGAAEHGRLDVVEFLIQNGALDGEDWEEQLTRAIMFAKRQAHNVVTGLLELHQRKKKVVMRQ